MQNYFYKSEAPRVVAIVKEFHQAKARWYEQVEALGKLFGGQVAPMGDGDSLYAGGVKLAEEPGLDVHWRRPDKYGFRALRESAVAPKGSSKEHRAAIRAEHERLVQLWKDNCPLRLKTHGYWSRLNVNTGNLWLCGGVKFEHQGVAYFHLGFPINQAAHEARVANGEPTSGWIEGAVEILPSEYENARQAKVGAPA